MAATFQNGHHENIISYFGGFLCVIHALIGFQGQRIHFLYFQTQIDVHFQNDGNIYTDKYRPMVLLVR